MSTWINTDNPHFSDRYPWRRFTIQHTLNNHPSLSLERLVEVARSLPRERVEFNLGTVDIGMRPEKVPINGLTPEETVRRIEENKSWIVLKYVEQIPEYKQLLDQCLADIRQFTDKNLDGLHAEQAFIFISSPGSVTPYHIDQEHNFLLQIRGNKTMHVWDPDDRVAMPEEAVEATVFGANAHRNLPWDDNFRQRGEAVSLTPGAGVYVPVHSPHWVKNGDAVSISFSITFRSAWSRRYVGMFALNAKLRSLGWRPAPVGQSALRDKVKYGLFLLMSSLLRKKAA
ncbi:MAG: cupin-like domain-containing protein [Alcanivoracaceae bacterium]|nr:cupin-like domain-containing protein [Alcanivoracaceae bacterium]